MSELKFKNHFHVQLIRNGKVIHEEDVPNGVTDVGINRDLDVMFHGTAASGTWYIGMIDNNGFSALAAGDTMAAHAGWTEFNKFVGANTRLAWNEGAAAAKSMTSSSTTDYTINAAGVVYGIFLCDDDASVSQSNGLLWATAAFAATITVANTDVLRITYTVSAS